MKHVWVPGSNTRYAFVAVDVTTKQAIIHVGGTSTASQAKLALQKVIDVFGRGITLVTARPHTPKDKPHVENLIGKLQTECLDEDRTARSVPDLQHQVNRWLNDYHFFRPHQALGYQTPAEYCATLGLTIPRAEVSTM